MGRRGRHADLGPHAGRAGLTADVRLKSLKTVRGGDHRWREVGTPLGRLTIRAKLPLGFALAMAIVLVAAGVVLLGRVEQQLDRTSETDLRLQAGDMVRLISASRQAGDRLTIDGSAGRLVQVLDLRNRVVAASPELRGDRC